MLALRAQDTATYNKVKLHDRNTLKTDGQLWNSSVNFTVTLTYMDFIITYTNAIVYFDSLLEADKAYLIF